MRPIFVVGCQRSGSTMLGAILGSHSKMSAIPEAQFTADCIPTSTDKFVLSKTLEQIKNHYRFKIWNYSLPSINSDLSTYADVIKWIVQSYSEAINDKKQVDYWIDHQPGHIKHINKLKTQFPDLKVIHIIRDGRAVASSIMNLDWGPNSVTRAAYYWEQRLAYGMALERFLGSDCFAVKYEDLITEPDTEIAKICDFLGVEFEPNMITGGGFKVPEFTKNQHSMVGSKPQRSKIEAWKTKLSQREIEIFESITGDLLDYLGYQKVCLSRPQQLSVKEKIAYDVKHIINAVGNRVAFAKRVKRFT